MNTVDRIIKLIDEKRLTKTKVLRDLGLATNSFNNWIKRGTSPQGEALKKIAEYLNVSTDYLLGRDSEGSDVFDNQEEHHRPSFEFNMSSKGMLLTLYDIYEIGIEPIDELCLEMHDLAKHFVISEDGKSVADDRDYKMKFYVNKVEFLFTYNSATISEELLIKTYTAIVDIAKRYTTLQKQSTQIYFDKIEDIEDTAKKNTCNGHD